MLSQALCHRHQWWEREGEMRDGTAVQPTGGGKGPIGGSLACPKPALLILSAFTTVVALSVVVECAGHLTSPSWGTFAVALAAICAIGAQCTLSVLGGGPTIVAVTILGMRTDIAASRSVLADGAWAFAVIAVGIEGAESIGCILAAIVAYAVGIELAGVDAWLARCCFS